MADGITDLQAECEQQDASDDVESGSKQDVTNDPSVIQGPDDEDELRDDVYNHTRRWEDEVGDEKGYRICVAE